MSYIHDDICILDHTYMIIHRMYTYMTCLMIIHDMCYIIHNVCAGYMTRARSYIHDMSHDHTHVLHHT